MATSNILAPVRLEPNKYEPCQKEMNISEMTTNAVEIKRTPAVFFNLTGKVSKTFLEMDPNVLNEKESKTKQYIKLYKLFKVDTNLSAHGKYEIYSRKF